MKISPETPKTKYARLLLFSLLLIFNGQVKSQVYLDSTQSVEVRVNDLLNRMTLQEKIGQMVQAERQAFSNTDDITTYYIGSLLSGGGSAPTPNTGKGWADMYDTFQQKALATRLSIPMIYGVDAVHGHNNVMNAVIFPHNIGLGCTRNPQLVQEAAEITAREIKGSGLNWTFAPCIAVTRNERWGRTYEGFGETPELVTQMGAATIKGFQGDSLHGKASILACAKHYIGDGGTTNGQDQGNTEVSETQLRQLYLPAYQAAIESGVGTVMASYSSWNGQKMHSHKYLLTDVLKTELGFDGFVVSDWAAIDQLPGDYTAQVESSINAGVDMIMLPYNYKEFIETVTALVSQNRITQSRIDDAVRRILRIKFKAGLFEHPYSDRTFTDKIGYYQHREVARECVRQSIVLLQKKDHILPLKKSGVKIHVAGKNADNIGNQCGGWSITWQGSSGDITQGTTVFEAVKNVAGEDLVTYSSNGSGVGDADIAIAVVGETPYAEGQGDRADLSLTTEDVNTVRTLKQAGIPVIVILISGRPMLINNILPYCDAIIAAWLPGTEGEGITDILFGDFQPSGLLSNSWPRDMQQVPVNVNDANYNPLFGYGYGITSLTDSEVGSSPLYYSSSVTMDGTAIEVSFNKSMAEPAEFGGFALKSNTAGIQLSDALLKAGDSTTIILKPAQPIKKGDRLTLSYIPGSIKSSDGGLLQSFSAVKVYNLMDENKIHVVPGIVQAEDFFSMVGVQTENTTDIGGGMNVGWIDAGDRMEYYLSVPVNGIYNFDLRSASLSDAGEIQFKIADSTLASISIPVSGGWQKWQTNSVSLKLNKGLTLLKFFVKKGGFNLNWFKVSLVYEIVDDTTPNRNYLYQNYPNPFYRESRLKYELKDECQVKLSIIDMSGKEVAV
ncbi:MAG: glycoside hydrolase family 3 N-terminal domain-containing protein, partial [Chloroflexota bacterium]